MRLGKNSRVGWRRFDLFELSQKLELGRFDLIIIAFELDQDFSIG